MNCSATSGCISCCSCYLQIFSIGRISWTTSPEFYRFMLQSCLPSWPPWCKKGQSRHSGDSDVPSQNLGLWFTFSYSPPVPLLRTCYCHNRIWSSLSLSTSSSRLSDLRRPMRLIRWRCLYNRHTTYARIPQTLLYKPTSPSPRPWSFRRYYPKHWKTFLPILCQCDRGQHNGFRQCWAVHERRGGYAFGTGVVELYQIYANQGWYRWSFRRSHVFTLYVPWSDGVHTGFPVSLICLFTLPFVPIRLTSW